MRGNLTSYIARINKWAFSFISAGPEGHFPLFSQMAKNNSNFLQDQCRDGVHRARDAPPLRAGAVLAGERREVSAVGAAREVRGVPEAAKGRGRAGVGE